MAKLIHLDENSDFREKSSTDNIYLSSVDLPLVFEGGLNFFPDGLDLNIFSNLSLPSTDPGEAFKVLTNQNLLLLLSYGSITGVEFDNFAPELTTGSINYYTSSGEVILPDLSSVSGDNKILFFKNLSEDVLEITGDIDGESQTLNLYNSSGYLILIGLDSWYSFSYYPGEDTPVTFTPSSVSITVTDSTVQTLSNSSGTFFFITSNVNNPTLSVPRVPRLVLSGAVGTIYHIVITPESSGSEAFSMIAQEYPNGTVGGALEFGMGTAPTLLTFIKVNSVGSDDPGWMILSNSVTDRAVSHNDRYQWAN